MHPSMHVSKNIPGLSTLIPALSIEIIHHQCTQTQRILLLINILKATTSNELVKLKLKNSSIDFQFSSVQHLSLPGTSLLLISEH